METTAREDVIALIVLIVLIALIALIVLWKLGATAGSVHVEGRGGPRCCCCCCCTWLTANNHESCS